MVGAYLIDNSHHYATAEVSDLGLYQHDSIKAIKDAICKICHLKK